MAAGMEWSDRHGHGPARPAGTQAWHLPLPACGAARPAGCWRVQWSSLIRRRSCHGPGEGRTVSHGVNCHGRWPASHSRLLPGWSRRKTRSRAVAADALCAALPRSRHASSRSRAWHADGRPAGNFFSAGTRWSRPRWLPGAGGAERGGRARAGARESMSSASTRGVASHRSGGRRRELGGGGYCWLSRSIDRWTKRPATHWIGGAASCLWSSQTQGKFTCGSWKCNHMHAYAVLLLVNLLLATLWRTWIMQNSCIYKIKDGLHEFSVRTYTANSVRALFKIWMMRWDSSSIASFVVYSPCMSMSTKSCAAHHELEWHLSEVDRHECLAKPQCKDVISSSWPPLQSNGLWCQLQRHQAFIPYSHTWYILQQYNPHYQTLKNYTLLLRRGLYPFLSPFIQYNRNPT
jgi:hypothetical protein